ncbi:MAG: hypothetical protein HN802_03585 [Candidatus Jacksonbacteria bacterium]|jgi:predicted DNA-binding transcriptional regulator|nr:hypothetical protein [Candidatus Jacksonbacteria bacterium]MBT6034163.1 hypothetical protein [Candidatus Jacksonbacteria bacterium]MBT6756914.1 hypothetical protein [Candidatus Jacksonbacteria bacterium]MBT6955443.1 hypothetical protein [Candidatus Jacksonbacteria bacterium]MBT7008552.1 hypothetical protein [Candidatus Jacksonbacteria bacterium]
MYEHILQKLDLPLNEARIYETLLREGELSVGLISQKSGVYRRNVYDSLKNLVEKGFVHEVLTKKEATYQAAPPEILTEKIEQKESSLSKIMPNLENIYKDAADNEAVFIYKGVEGWKNYLQDMLRLKDDIYVLGAKGAWSDPRLKPHVAKASKITQKLGMKFYFLYDHGIKGDITKNAALVPNVEYKILPKGFDSPSVIDIFGDRLAISSNSTYGNIDEKSSITIIVNQQVADSFRTWFKFIWKTLPLQKPPLRANRYA